MSFVNQRLVVLYNCIIYTLAPQSNSPEYISNGPFTCAGSGWPPQERADGALRPDPNLRSAAAVHGEKPDGGQGRHLHQSGQRHTGDQEPHERHIQGGHDVLRLCN